MNSYYYFLTIHNSMGIGPEEIQEVLSKNFPSAAISVSDEEFENVR